MRILKTLGDALFRPLGPFLRNERSDLYLGLGKAGNTLLIASIFSNITFNFEFYSKLWGSKERRLLSFSNWIPSFYWGHSNRSYSSDRYLFCGKRPLAIAAMNAELPPFENGEHNSKSVSTADRDITPLKPCIKLEILFTYSSTNNSDST